ncbi:hypothetical protein [Treponema sp.]|uniref:hypothetical protein n=1 Tax=Treponema sp. TaxID=166 RepID=UPI002580CB20|nr:hypothetical protein [Treponema sp.]
MKRILFLAPSFFNYENVITECLALNNSVDFVDNQKHWNEYRVEWNKSLGRKILRKLLPPLKTNDREHLEKKFEEKYRRCYKKERDSYDVVFCIKGDCFPNGCYEELKMQNPKALFVLYQWDDIELLNKRNHFKYFSHIYSYNITDCKKYGYKYLPMFYQNENFNSDYKIREYDIAMIGTDHKERVKLVKKIYKKYNKKYKLFIYFVTKSNDTSFFRHQEPLSFSEYMNVLANSKVVLDIPHFKQTGPTTRVFDACVTKTKVISINKNLKKYPWYSSNIKFMNRRCPVISDTFINEPYNENDFVPLSLNRWINTIIGEFE